MPAREQIAVLLNDAKWIIIACLVFSALLFIPDQVLELYRIIYSQNPLKELQGFKDLIFLHAAAITIGLSVWFAASQVAAATRYRIATPARSLEFVAAALPLLLGALPMIACTVGFLDAVPARDEIEKAALSPPGSIWDEMATRLAGLALRLRWGAAVQAILTLSLVVWGWSRAVRMHKLADRLNKSHFGRPSGIVVALVLIVSVTAAVYAMPVTLPRLVTAFGIAALFAVCILAFVTNFSLLGIRYRFPFIALPCLTVVVFSLDSCNDNHAIRLLDRPDPAALQAADEQQAADQFSTWLDSRPDRRNYAGEGDEYPVYIVSSQGGGIYAAYQSAIFLARLQDVCPAFRHHLFAISSVSGGSVGAAVFAAALNAYDHDLIELTQKESEARAQAKPTGALDPCPAITKYRTDSRVLPTEHSPGPLERAVQRALKQDFIAPLLAATLFTDFTQQFLPRPVLSFDRARSLEYALERAGQEMMKATAPPDEVSRHNAFAGSILNLWKADGSMPALLINATDAASGRRFVVSPFRVAAQPPGETPATLDYRFWNKDLPEPDRARDIRLSTAAFVSARFPWVTPAATTAYDQPGKPDERIRLVDGGYVDNSGVETALDLNGAIAGVLQRREQGKEKPKARVNLVVLSGGDFPVRKSFSFGDLMEPLRALLSTGKSRAYVAIDRARKEIPPYPVDQYPFGGEEIQVQPETLKKASLPDSRFYQLPLGWSLSQDTREIIEAQSGRYWECLPDSHFLQAQTELAQSDCVELLIYYELNKALTGDSKKRVEAQVAISSYLARKEEQEEREAGAEENGIIRCYRRATRLNLNLEQAGNVRAVIRQWGKQWREKYPRRDDLPAYVLATAAFESSNFRAREQSLSYSTPDQILKAWPTRENIQNMSPAELEKYVRHPEELAEQVFGGAFGERLFGNVPGSGDAWNYRPRGLAYVRGRENYQKVADSWQLKDLMDDPDLLLIPEINASSFIDIYFRAERMPELARLLGDAAARPDRDEGWKNARNVVLKNAGRAEDAEGFEEIASKTETFRKCIALAHEVEAKAASR